MLPRGSAEGAGVGLFVVHAKAFFTHVAAVDVLRRRLHVVVAGLHLRVAALLTDGALSAVEDHRVDVVHLVVGGELPGLLLRAAGRAGHLLALRLRQGYLEVGLALRALPADHAHRVRLQRVGGLRHSVPHETLAL